MATGKSAYPQKVGHCLLLYVLNKKKNKKNKPGRPRRRLAFSRATTTDGSVETGTGELCEVRVVQPTPLPRREIIG